MLHPLFLVKPVKTNINSISLESFQPRCNECANTIRTQISVTVYSQVLIRTAAE